MNRRRLLIVTLLLVLLAGGSLAALLALRGGDEVERSAGGFTSQTGGASTAAPAEPENGTVPIRFVFNDSYEAGETVAVAIENIGTMAYVFQSFYQACFLSYFDSKTGRSSSRLAHTATCSPRRRSDPASARSSSPGSWTSA